MKRILNKIIKIVGVTAVLLVSIAPVYAEAEEAYDHFQHGFELDGAHRDLTCEACHKGGTFQGTPRDCAVCHDGSSILAESGVVSNHIATTGFCDSCHITADWVTILHVDHGEVFGPCTSCHNDTFANGLPPNHVATTAECDQCHLDLAWLPAGFDHFGITAGCSACHNGIDATGKNISHIVTTDACEDCHTVDFFTPVFRVDHTQVIGTCVSCHNGSVATGKDAEHPPASDICDDCHTVDAWEPALEG